MSETHTCQVEFGDQEPYLSGSANWQEDFAADNSMGRPTRGFMRSAVLALALMASTAAIPILDPPPLDVRTSTSPVLAALMRRALPGRRISLREARQIALQIMENAEEERLKVVAEEATEGIDWL